MTEMHPAERLATLARLAEVRQVLAAIRNGALASMPELEVLLRARERLYAEQTEPNIEDNAGAGAAASQGRLW